jgi:ribonuclease G
MPSELLINAGAAETRIAWVEDGVLQAYSAAPSIGGRARLGDIHLGRVARVMPAMQATFVEIGDARAGFLALAQARTLATKVDPAISDCLREGEAVVVQVMREAAGDKGARLTADVALTPELEVACKLARPPALLQRGPGPVERALRDCKANSILIDDARVVASARKVHPHLTIELAKDDLFARHDLEEQIALLSQSRVALVCGGWITIEAVEALTVIDVDSGSFASAGDRAETSRIVNLEAAREAGRQIRLRGIGGLIVIDFIQMESGAERVVVALKDSLARGGTPSEISPMTSFGIVAITRQRADVPLDSSEPCGVCGGSGARRSAQSIALEILRAAERSARTAPGRQIIVRAAPEVADWLAAHQEEVRAGLDRRGVGRMQILAEARRREDFDVAS